MQPVVQKVITEAVLQPTISSPLDKQESRSHSWTINADCLARLFAIAFLQILPKRHKPGFRSISRNLTGHYMAMTLKISIDTGSIDPSAV